MPCFPVKNIKKRQSLFYEAPDNGKISSSQAPLKRNFRVFAV